KLESTFPNKKKINFSIKTKNKSETTTRLFTTYPKPLIKRYDFIKGFEEGNLDFYSTKKGEASNSVLVIDNFKVKEVPIFAKLLSLASLQGIADLLTGEGIRFTDFEMNFSNKKGLTTIEELYAIGPAVSILMDGYIETKKLVSLRGTLVPATTINRTIASIPLLGKILIGDKTGEGVFGVSFKIKGPPKDLKTSVNPIKTLTPRFITRTLEKIKNN
ncbi:AsmA-like C-terminal region-containing protein, partial [Candidatus Pelagibacter sp.]|nr:AsmA-like C-terminal region-containing protein [Candidatus Pelagibacter sp.]